MVCELVDGRKPLLTAQELQVAATQLHSPPNEMSPTRQGGKDAVVYPASIDIRHGGSVHAPSEDDHVEIGTWTMVTEIFAKVDYHHLPIFTSRHRGSASATLLH